MRTARTLSAIALLASVVLVTQTRSRVFAADAAGAAPAMKSTAVLSISSYDDLHADLAYVFQSAGQPQLMQMVDGLIVQMTMGKGLVGIDTARPLGAVFRSDGQQMVPLVYLPVSDAPAMLDLLTAVFPQQEKIDEGLYQLTGPVQAYLRIDEGYAFAGLNRADLEGDLPHPDQFISPLARQYDLALTVNLADMPEPYKQMLLMQIRASAEQAAVRQENETDAEYRGRQLGAKLAASLGERLVEQGREVALGFRISERDKNLVLDLALEAQPGSELARDLAPLATVTSRFATLMEPGALMTFAMTCNLSDSLHASLHPLLVEARGEALNEIEASEKLKTEADRKKATEIVTRLFDVFLATVDARELDSVVTLRQEPDGTITVVGAGNFAESEQLGVAFKEAVGLAGDNPDIDTITLNAATHKGLAIHALEPKAPDEETKRFLGENPRLHVAFGLGAAFFAIGHESLAGIERAIDSADAPAGDALPGMPLLLEMSLGPWLEIAAQDAEEDRYLTLARESFSTGDRLRFALEGIPNGLRIRLQLEEGFIRFLGKATAAGFQEGMEQ